LIRVLNLSNVMAEKYTHCCADMTRDLNQTCDLHSNRFECADCLIAYSPCFREYGLIIHDGGSSMVVIGYCPWCGVQLPESLRDRWFEELDAMGIDPGEDDTIPEQYRSSEWWSKKPFT
jgi:hypothetical protein